MERQLNKATNLFREFTGHEPLPEDILRLTEDTVVAIVGNVHSISYSATRDSECETYIHEFPDRPVLAISFDGTQAFILAGGFKFTDKGFEP